MLSVIICMYYLITMKQTHNEATFTTCVYCYANICVHFFIMEEIFIFIDEADESETKESSSYGDSGKWWHN